MKPRVIWLLVMAAVAGSLYAGAKPETTALVAIVGVLSTGGAAAFNQYWERGIDALMSRTKSRPIPSGRVGAGRALAFAMALSLLGASAAVALGPLPLAFVLAGWAAYAVVYTILLKPRTWASVLLGGFAGPAAFLTGYTAASPLDLRGVLLSTAVWLWIPSHIWSLAYWARGDYSRAGIPMLPAVIKPDLSKRIISAFNILSSSYMMLLTLEYSRPLGIALTAAAAGVATVYSIKALLSGDEKAFRDMFKASSPVLALFLAGLVMP